MISSMIKRIISSVLFTADIMQNIIGGKFSAMWCVCVYIHIPFLMPYLQIYIYQYMKMNFSELLTMEIYGQHR